MVDPLGHLKFLTVFGKTRVGAVREPPLHQLRSVVMPVTTGIQWGMGSRLHGSDVGGVLPPLEWFDKLTTSGWSGASS